MRALVTGAGRGLGAGIASRLARDGWDVAVVDVDDRLKDTADELRAASGAAVLAQRLDVRDVPAVAAFADSVKDAFGGLELLVNNAGIGGPSLPLLESEIEDLRSVLDVNLLGMMVVTQAMIPLLQRAGDATVINLGSLYGHHPVADDVSYCASKGGVDALTRSLAIELAPRIRVNGVAPGLMATEMHWDDLRCRAGTSGDSFGLLQAAERERIPLGRHGTASDVAGVVAWLASPDAAYITGQMIRVDGGVVVG